MYDVMIIGAGIIGSTIAYELSKVNRHVLIVDKLESAGLDVSAANSAVVHDGVDPKEGTLKYKYNLEGTKMYEAYAKELETPYKQIGAFVVATSDADSKHIDMLIENGKKRDVFVERLSREEAFLRDPNLPKDTYEVLSMPTTAIIDPVHLSKQAIKKSVTNGVTAHFNEEVISITKSSDIFTVKTNKDTYEAKVVVNAAGLYAPEIEKMVSDSTFELTYIRGDYVILDKRARSMSNGALYPAPSNMGKGVLVIPQTDDRVLIGPTAFTITSLDDTFINDTDINMIKEKIKMVANEVPYEYQVGTMSGIRPKEVSDDFVIEESKHVSSFINVVGIDSPGVASAPAIAKDVVTNLISPKL